MKLIISTILLLFFYLSNGKTKPNNFYAGIKYSNNFLTKKIFQEMFLDNPSGWDLLEF